MTEPTGAPEAKVQRDQLRPGAMRCAKCKFRLVRVNLHVCTGTFSCGSSESEPCPNGCGPLWPVTWKEDCIDAEAQAEKYFMEAKELRERVEPQQAANDEKLQASLRSLRDSLEGRLSYEEDATLYNAIMRLGSLARPAVDQVDETVSVSIGDLRLVLDEPCIEGSMSRPDGWFEAKARLLSILPKEPKGA